MSRGYSYQDVRLPADTHRTAFSILALLSCTQHAFPLHPVQPDVFYDIRSVSSSGG
ncbi:hypothetical protein BDZ89DRAFT_563592 [Hymenopellis radicata]|nr:hypothetical protein BDZ89DRAFT_563592 [Hymenopellis radicata]